MVISLNFVGLGVLGKAFEQASCLIVRICKGHYIWCLASAQATTGSVPVCFAGLLDRGQINPGFSLGIVAFHLLKKGPGRHGFWGFRMADSGPMRPAEHFLF
jgi:hypothetical protein